MTAPLLGDPGELAKYDAVMINCGSSDEAAADNTSLVSNLKNYVSNGGMLYASDWAYVFVEAGWPEYIDFYGDDNISYSAEMGDAGLISGTINEPIKSYLQKSTMEINFDLAGWAMIDHAPEVDGKQVTVLISGPRPGGGSGAYPLMVQFPFGAGKVLYTSFHNEAQATADMVSVLNIIALGGV
jgi:hypothetical protein